MKPQSIRASLFQRKAKHLHATLFFLQLPWPLLHQEYPFSYIFLLKRLLWRIIVRFPDGKSSFACLFAKKRNQTKPNNHPKATTKISTWKKHSSQGKKKEKKKKSSASRTQQKDCWLLHSAGMLYKITYIPIWNKMSQQFLTLHLYFTNTSAKRSCKFYSQFFCVLWSFYSIFKAIFRL